MVLAQMGTIMPPLLKDKYSANENEYLDQKEVKKMDQEISVSFENYSKIQKIITDIFNRMCRGELNLKMFSRFLFVLKEIEDGKCNVHEGSFMVGKLLKEIYIDSAIKKGDNVSVNYPDPPAPTYVTPKNITWTEYRKTIS